MLVLGGGYGFAKVSKEEKKKWGELMEEFLRTIVDSNKNLGYN